ncbi:DUF1963 domain-containing protein [Leminorella grimontii]|uniref:DUF1963 domain-containing protein n=1 Tax=Leminorella grimontii TaxID=82981 RepID=UPI00321FEF8E
MSLFHEHTRLAAALAASTLSASVQNKVMEQARPAVAFVRRQHDMVSVQKCCSRLGGLPDWPPGKGWPMREKPVDASARILALKEELARNTTFAEEMENMYQSIQEPLNGEQKAIFQQVEAKQAERLKALQLAQIMDFPLAFVVQLNLEELSQHPGFDPKLPKRGLLSFFRDITRDDAQPFVFWHDVALDALRSLPAPEALIELHDKYIGEPWRSLTQVECLEPRSVISVPAVCPGLSETEQEIYERWYKELIYLDNEYKAVFDEEDASYGGELLGGWAEPIQQSVEEELNAEAKGDESLWRLLFTWSEECYADTALLSGLQGGGTYYAMIREDDLTAWRFDRVSGELQFD